MMHLFSLMAGGGGRRAIFGGLVGLAAVLSAVAADAHVLPRDGDYLSTAYIAALEKANSHHKAWNTTEGSPVVTVSHNKAGLISLLIGTWHEGIWAKFDPKKPSENLDRESGITAQFVWIDREHFAFGTGEDQQRYRYVGKAENFIARRLLVGVYSDWRGRKYVFGADGKARFPDRTFRYEPYLDMTFEDGDEFTDLDASKPNHLKVYGFAWKGEELYLYKAGPPQEGPSWGIDRKHPIAILRRVRAE
jgi:hypothetical protein